MAKLNWRQARRDEKCPQCGKHDRYSIASNGASKCHRCQTVYRAAGASSSNGRVTGYVGEAHRPKPQSLTNAKTPPVDWSAEYERLRAAMTDERLLMLAKSTALPVSAWAAVAPGWADAEDLRRLRAGGAGWAENCPEGAYVFAERTK